MTSQSKSQQFVTLWTAHGRQVYGYIFSLVANSTDADDLFQETSITLMQKFDEFDPQTNFSAWACRVAYFKTLSHLKARRQAERFNEQFYQSLEHEAQEFAAESDVRLAALSRCLLELSAKDQKLIKIRYQKNLPVSEVAKQAGRSAVGVYQSLSRIHDALLACVRRRMKGDAP